MNPVEDQLPPPPQPHRISTSCDRHPDEQFTGFCPSCLCERLVILDKSAAAASSATAGRKSASSAIRSIFRSVNSTNAAGDRPSFRARPGSFLPELRRTKSFSSGKNDAGFGFGFAGISEPQRKSCDVRGRSTLHSLFNQDDGNKRAAAANSAGTDQIEGKFSNSNGIVIEFNEEDDREPELSSDQVPSGEIEEIEDISNPKLSSEEQLGEISEDLKPMKDHLDLDLNKKAGGKVAGSFWSAASVFSKKLRSWTRKNSKLKKHTAGSRTVQVSKNINSGRSCRETQSEIADYGYGRRSCDTDPRFSLDVGRMSLDYGRISIDDPRYSFDEPRASWDGCLIAGRPPAAFPRPPSMLSVVEGSPAPPPPPPPPPPPIVPSEEPRRSINDEDGLPGGAAQTKDYYEDSFSRRRKSLDRSNSIRKTAANIVTEMDDLRDDCSKSFDYGFGNANPKKSKSWRSWNIWGLIVRRGGAKDDENDRPWQDPRISFRSNSSVSWRKSSVTSVATNGHSKNGLERNRSARYSPNDDNGLLRFYLTPMRGSRRGVATKAKPAVYSHTIARSMLGMY